MKEKSLIFTIFIILCTLLPALIPSLFLFITNSHFATQILTPICYDLGQQSGQQIFNHKLCMSCFEKGEYSSPFKLQITETNSQVYSNPQSHKKRVIKIGKKAEKLSSILSCEDLLEMLDIKIPIESFTDVSIDKINFEQGIQSIQQIITSTNITIQPSTPTQTIFISKTTNYFAILQLLSIQSNPKETHALIPQSHLSDLSTTDPLNQVRYLSNQYQTDYLLLLNILCKVSIGLCFVAFILKRYSEKVLEHEIFASITVILGFLISFNDYGLETNNFYFISAELLFMGLCLNKAGVIRSIILAYILIQTFTFFIPMFSNLLEFLRILFYFLTTIIIYYQSRKSIEKENLGLYLTLIWSTLTLLLTFDACQRSFVFVIAHSTILILSTSFAEFLTKRRTEQFEEFIGGSKFTKIKTFQEMEEIVDFS